MHQYIPREPPDWGLPNIYSILLGRHHSKSVWSCHLFHTNIAGILYLIVVGCDNDISERSCRLLRLQCGSECPIQALLRSTSGRTSSLKELLTDFPLCGPELCPSYLYSNFRSAICWNVCDKLSDSCTFCTSFVLWWIWQLITHVSTQSRIVDRIDRRMTRFTNPTGLGVTTSLHYNQSNRRAPLGLSALT